MENMSASPKDLFSKMSDESAKRALIGGVRVGRHGSGKPDTNSVKRGMAI